MRRKTLKVSPWRRKKTEEHGDEARVYGKTVDF
jgi:hypothetical protein